MYNLKLYNYLIIFICRNTCKFFILYDECLLLLTARIITLLDSDCINTSDYCYTRVADNEVKMVTDEYCKPLHFVVRGQF